MAEIDPVILELRADLMKYQATMRRQAADTERQLGRSERAVQRLERQMLKSSTAIQSSLVGIGGALGTYFSGRELVGLIDGFTRLQNSLRVAGLEGDALARVQGELLQLSARYGVSIGDLANLYGQSAQAASDLGASEAQLIQLTEASAQALKITGTSAAQAQGALLGLTQALASGTVRAEEFNQINEGGLRPLLQVVANTEKYGGSVAKLRLAVVEGKVSSQEFYQAILNGSAELDAKAAKAVLTLVGAFGSLVSALTVYVGEAAQTSGATETLAAALQGLAKNLDLIIPALTIIGLALAGRFVAGSVAAAAALRTLTAYISIATTSLAGTALAARGAGAALLAAFGGPVGVAITAVAVGLGLVTTQMDTSRQASGQYAAQQEALAKIQDKTREATEAVASATGRARNEAIANARALRQEAEQYLSVARAALVSAKAKAVSAQQDARTALNQATAKTGRGFEGALGASQSTFDAKKQADANLAAANANVIGAQKEIERLTAIINGSVGPKVQAVEAEKPKRTRSASGPSAEDIEARFQSELISIAQATLSARQSLATSAEERAELELRAVELARREALNRLETEKDYSDVQKDRLRDAIENQVEFERERVAREKSAQLADEAAQLADEQYRAESDALRDQYELARSQAERRTIGQAILDLEYRYREAVLQGVIAAEGVAEAQKEQARIALAALQNGRAAKEEGLRRDTAGPLEGYFDSAIKDANELREAYESIAVDGLQSVTDALTETATGFLKLGGVAGRVIDGIISDLIRLVIQQQIAGLVGSIFGGGSPASGIAAGFRGFGRSGGGYVAPGQMVRVNEHRGGFEGFQPTGSGKIIPLGQMNALAARDNPGGGGVATVRLMLSGDIDARIDQRSATVAVEVVRATADDISNLGAQKAVDQLTRPRL